MKAIDQVLETIIKKYPTDHITVGLSGGIDSVVLLYALNQLKKTNAFSLFSLSAIHINHNLHDDATQWADFCQKYVNKLNIPLTIVTLTTKPKSGESIEAWARKMRFDAFDQILTETNCQFLYLAHHQNDQAETMIFNLIRGSGIDGLSAMPKVRKNNGYNILRPFLDIPRKEIISYAKLNQLQWMDDPSNQDIRFDRNFIRHEILEKLVNRFSALNNIVQSSYYCQEAKDLLNDYLQTDLALMVNEKNQIKHDQLIQLDPVKQTYLIRLWLKLQNITPPRRKKMTNLIQTIATAKNNWQFYFGEHVLIIYDQLIFVYKNSPEIPSDFSLFWQGDDLYLAEYDFFISQSDLTKLGIDCSKINWNLVTLRARTSQDYCRPIGRDKKNKLKIIYQEKRIPKWLRDRTPIVEYHGKIIAVGKLFGCCYE